MVNLETFCKRGTEGLHLLGSKNDYRQVRLLEISFDSENKIWQKSEGDLNLMKI